jgi:hypothetical protein
MTNPGEQPRRRHLVLQDFLDNFPLPEIRPKQREVLQEICDAFNASYRYIVLEGSYWIWKKSCCCMRS